MRRTQRGVAWLAAVIASIVGAGGCCSLTWCQQKGLSPVVLVGPEDQPSDVQISKKLNQQVTWVFVDNKVRRVVVTLGNQPVPFKNCIPGSSQTCVITCTGQVCRSGAIGDFEPPKKGYSYDYHFVDPDGEKGADPRIIIKP